MNNTLKLTAKPSLTQRLNGWETEIGGLRVLICRVDLGHDRPTQLAVFINTEDMGDTDHTRDPSSPAAADRAGGIPEMQVCLGDAVLYDCEPGTNGVDKARRDTVYVVRPDDASDDIAAFEREQDAEAYASVFPADEVGDVETVLVADATFAADMIRNREDSYAEDDREARPYVIADGGDDGVIERFRTPMEAEEFRDSLDPSDENVDRYYIDGPRYFVLTWDRPHPQIKIGEARAGAAAAVGLVGIVDWTNRDVIAFGSREGAQGVVDTLNTGERAQQHLSGEGV